MAEFVGRGLQQVRAGESSPRPEFVVVEMRVAAENREKCVSQSPALAVERISVAVFAFLEPDVDVDATGALLGEGQVRVLRPNVQGLFDLVVDVVAIQSPRGRISADFVGQILDPPSAALQSVSLPSNVSLVVIVVLVHGHVVLHPASRHLHHLLGLGVQNAGHRDIGELLKVHDGVLNRVRGQQVGASRPGLLHRVVHITVSHQVHLRRTNTFNNGGHLSERRRFANRGSRGRKKRNAAAFIL